LVDGTCPPWLAVPPLTGSRSRGIFYLPVVPDQASLVLLDSGLLNPSGLE